MRIRQNYSIQDRIKVLILLVLVLLLLGKLANYIHLENSCKESATIEYMIEKALGPVGTTMYIWGGGWNDEDSQSGTSSTRIGLSPKWKAFANQQDVNYDYEEHRFERENGLDCSGYVGWVIYNTFETKTGQEGYVTTSTDLAASLANRGWGNLIYNPKEFMPGDIVSMDGHVWICLGCCEDGSVLLVHSSPPGVSMCGTPIPAHEGNEANYESLAMQLATEYMTTYHPKWQEKYPNRGVSTSYMENVSVFRWNEKTMTDAKEVQKLSGEEIFYAIIR